MFSSEFKISARLVIATAMAVAVSITLPASGDIILFDDAPQTDLVLWSGAELSRDDDPVDEGTRSLRMERLRFQEAGLNASRANAIDVTGASVIRLRFNLAAGNVANINLVAFNGATRSAFTYNNSNSEDWTLDGNPGSFGDLILNTWHTLELDLAQFPGLVEGTNDLARVAFRPGTAGFTAFVDDVNIIIPVPEPGAISLLSLGLLVCLRGRRSARVKH